MMLPDDTCFPVVYDGSVQSAFDTLHIVARQIETDPDELHLDFYSNGIKEIDSGSIDGRSLFISAEPDSNKSVGLYFGKQDDEKYHISLEEENLRDPPGLVATLAHEIAHIKLLGEGRLSKNNESLTDLTTVFFGFGLFSANTAFRFNKGKGSWGYRSQGYLSQIEWGYALAMYAYRSGNTSPLWARSLSATVLGNFKRGMKYLQSVAP